MFHIKFPKPLQSVKNHFYKWLNNWLESCIAAQPKGTTDIIVDTRKDGSYLYLSDKYKKGDKIRYLYDNLYRNDTDETLAARQSRITSYVNSNGTDGVTWNASTAKNAYRKGDIVRVLIPPNDESGNPVYSYSEPLSAYKNVNWSSSAIFSTDEIVNGSLVSKPGTYICVANIPASSSIAIYNQAVASGMDLQSVRAPGVSYAPYFSEAKVNAQFFGTEPTTSGSKFEDYQGRYWECIGLFATATPPVSWFKGDYDSSIYYEAGDGVFINLSSSNGGLYMCVESLPGVGPTYAPTVGAPWWVQLSTSNTRGSWN